MAINYVCRYCKTPLGQLNELMLSEEQLGFHTLTADERKDIMTYDTFGNLTVRVICDHCKEAVEEHPELSHTNLLQ